MATSGTYTYSLTGTALLKNAMIDAGVLRDDQSVDTSMEAWGLYRLNLILKNLETVGLHMWRTKDITLILEDGKSSYTLGAGGDRCAEDMVRTTLSAAEATSSTVLDVASSADMTAADVIGVELSSGAMHWDTIVTVDSATQVTVTTGLVSAAASGAAVYAYTSLAPVARKIHEAYVIRKASETSHTPINIISQSEYMNYSDKTTESYPTSIFFRPDLETAEIKIWPLSDNNVARIVMMAELPMENLDALTDEVALPPFWYEVINSMLVHRIALSYGAPMEKIREYKKLAEEAEERAKGYGGENSYVQFEFNEYDWYN